MNTTIVNGRRYDCPDGANVSVINNKMYVNGQPVDDFSNDEKNIEIIINGNVDEVKTDTGNITVNGNISGDATTDCGNITVGGDIRGNVKTDCGNVSANGIAGKCSTDCGNITGASFDSKKSKNKSVNNIGDFVNGLADSIMSSFKGFNLTSGNDSFCDEDDFEEDCLARKSDKVNKSKKKKI